MDDSKKLKEITSLQSFGIFLVVLGHSYPSFHYSPFADWVYHFIYSFHMPLFMSISGFLFVYTGGIKNHYIRFLKNKTRRLLFPYFILSSIAFIPKTFLSEYASRPIDLNFKTYVKSLVFPDENAISFFWFLPVLFLIFAISPFISRALQQVNTILCFTVLFLLLHLYNPLQEIAFLKMGHVFTYLVYFWTGCLIGQFKSASHLWFEHRYVRILSATLFIVLCSDYTPSSLLTLLTSLTGIMMSFSFMRLYAQNNLNFMNFIDGYSYQIYLLSWFPQVFLKVFIYQLLNFPFYLTAFLMAVGGLLCPIVITNIVQKHFSYLLPLLGLQTKPPAPNIRMKRVF